MFFYQTHSPAITETANDLILIIKLNVFVVSFTKIAVVLLCRPQHTQNAVELLGLHFVLTYIYSMVIPLKPHKKVSNSFFFFFFCSVVLSGGTTQEKGRC